MAKDKQDKKDRSENKILARISDYKQVFGSQAGERVLQDLMRFSGMLGDESGQDAFTISFNSGQRNIVKMILKNINTNEGDILRHIEQLENRKRAGHA